jgi:branched-chain amino acid aminotransferase
MTPSISNDILESVTRDSVLKLIEDIYGIKPIERDIDRSELVAADEAFFCGTAWEITPILSIDRINIGTGQIGKTTKELQDIFFAASEGRKKEYMSWCHPVYG